MKKEFIILFLIILLANILLYSSIVIKNNKEQISNVNTIYENGIRNYALDNSTQNYDISQPVLNTAELAKQIEEQRLAKEKAEQEARKRDEENKKKQEEYQAKLEQERQALINKENNKSEYKTEQKVQEPAKDSSQNNNSGNNYSLNNNNSSNKTNVISNYQVIGKGKIVNDFNGIDQYNIYELSNNSLWIQTNYKYKYNYSYNPDVILYKDGIKYYLYINCIDEFIEVEEVPYTKTRIQEAYNSYGTTVHSLYNGYIYYLADNTVWEQVGLGLGTFISNSEVFIYEYNNQYYMKVKNVNDSVRVQRIK